MKRLVLILLSILLFGSAVRAQNDLQLTQYWAMPSYFNPAFTGSTDYLRIRGGARLQWLGIHNAPKSFLASADTPLKFGKKHFGLGVTAMQESYGLFSDLHINIQASYKFNLLKGVFSVGVQGGYLNSKFKGSDIYIPDNDDYHEGNDTSLPSQDLTGNGFDLSLGVTYTHKYFSLGLSGLHLLNPRINMAVEGSESTESTEYETEVPRILYFTASGNIPLKNTLFELQPSMCVRTDFSQVSGDITMRALFNKFLSFGIGYRLNDAVCVMIGAEFKNFFIGYAYDYPTSAIAKGSAGSHELLAGYQLKLDFSGKNKNKHRSIRLM